MIDECSIDRDKPHAFERALREEEAIERVARRRWRLDPRQDMRRENRNDRQTHVLDQFRQPIERRAGFELSKPRFDSDFPKTCDAYEKIDVRRRQCRSGPRIETIQLILDQEDQDLRIEKQPHEANRHQELENLPAAARQNRRRHRE